MPSAVIGLGRTSEEVSVFSEGAKNVLLALQFSESDRLNAVTGVGAGDSKDSGSFFYDQIYRKYFLNTVYADKDREEAIIQASDAKHVARAIFQAPGIFIQMGSVSRADTRATRTRVANLNLLADV